MDMCSRREMLGALAMGLPLRGATPSNRIGRNRISAITDEIALSPAGAVAFLQQYGLKWAELRDTPGPRNTPGARKYYPSLPETELKQAAKQFADGGIKVSFLNASLLKFGLPGTEPLDRKKEDPSKREARISREQARFDTRMDDLDKVVRTAQIFGVRDARIFTFSRVEDPQSVYQRIADVIGPMAERAKAGGVRLLIENETSCNVAGCGELAAMLRLLPSGSIGCNWDVMNGMAYEKPFPDGYALLPKSRIHNVQMKGKTILNYPEHLDWAPIFQALGKDGFDGEIGLETHIFGEGQVQASHDSMKEILRIIEA